MESLYNECVMGGSISVALVSEKVMVIVGGSGMKVK